MYQQYFADSDLLVWPLIGLVIFVVSFLGVMWYVLYGLSDVRKRNHIAALPLDDVLVPNDGSTSNDLLARDDEKGGSGE